MSPRAPDLVNADQAAAIAGIAPATFRWLRTKATTKTPPPAPVVATGRTILYRRTDIEKWAERRDRATGRAPRKENK